MKLVLLLVLLYSNTPQIHCAQQEDSRQLVPLTSVFENALTLLDSSLRGNAKLYSSLQSLFQDVLSFLGGGQEHRATGFRKLSLSLKDFATDFLTEEKKILSSVIKAVGKRSMRKISEEVLYPIMKYAGVPEARASSLLSTLRKYLSEKSISAFLAENRIPRIPGSQLLLPFLPFILMYMGYRYYTGSSHGGYGGYGGYGDYGAYGGYNPYSYGYGSSYNHFNPFGFGFASKMDDTSQYDAYYPLIYSILQEEINKQNRRNYSPTYGDSSYGSPYRSDSSVGANERHSDGGGASKNTLYI